MLTRRRAPRAERLPLIHDLADGDAVRRVVAAIDAAGESVAEPGGFSQSRLPPLALSCLRMLPSPDPAHDTALAAFIAFFDAGDFFEAHEILEAFWVGYRGDDRDFYRGLIQAAVALHHLGTGNSVGARGVAERARKNLEPYAPCRDDVDVDAILARLAAA